MVCDYSWSRDHECTHLGPHEVHLCTCGATIVYEVPAKAAESQPADSNDSLMRLLRAALVVVHEAEVFEEAVEFYEAFSEMPVKAKDRFLGALEDWREGGFPALMKQIHRL